MKNVRFVGSGILGTFLNMPQKTSNLGHILKEKLQMVHLTVFINKTIIDMVCTCDHLFIRMIICTFNKE